MLQTLGDDAEGEYLGLGHCLVGSCAVRKDAWQLRHFASHRPSSSRSHSMLKSTAISCVQSCRFYPSRPRAAEWTAVTTGWRRARGASAISRRSRRSSRRRQPRNGLLASSDACLEDQNATTSGSLQILRARKSLISRCRGTVDALPLARLTYTECFAPSRRRAQSMLFQVPDQLESLH